MDMNIVVIWTDRDGFTAKDHYSSYGVASDSAIAEAVAKTEKDPQHHTTVAVLINPSEDRVKSFGFFA